MFCGATTLNLDAKGRIGIPARYRDELADMCQGELVVTVDWQDRCLLVYPGNEWNNVQKRLMELPTFEPQARQLSRLLMGYATNVKLDGHSRIPLSQSQRVYAGLDKRAVLIGQGNKFELWDEDQWNERCNLWLAEDHQETGLSETIANLRI